MVFKRGRPPGKMLQLSGPSQQKLRVHPGRKTRNGWHVGWSLSPVCVPRGQTVPPPAPARLHSPRARPPPNAGSSARLAGGVRRKRGESRSHVWSRTVSSHVRGPAPSLRGWGEPHRAWGGTFRFWGSPRVAPSRCQGALPRSWRPPWPDGAFCQELTPPFAVALQPMLTDAEVLPQDSRPQKVGEPLGAAVPGRGGRSVSLGRDCLRRVGWWGHLTEPHWPLRPGQGPAPAGGLQTHQTK